MGASVGMGVGVVSEERVFEGVGCGVLFCSDNTSERREVNLLSERSESIQVKSGSGYIIKITIAIINASAIFLTVFPLFFLGLTFSPVS